MKFFVLSSYSLSCYSLTQLVGSISMGPDPFGEISPRAGIGIP